MADQLWLMKRIREEVLVLTTEVPVLAVHSNYLYLLREYLVQVCDHVTIQGVSVVTIQGVSVVP